jgi:hypothetical protein
MPDDDIETDIETDLVDLTAVPLADVWTSEDPLLLHSIEEQTHRAAGDE